MTLLGKKTAKTLIINIMWISILLFFLPLIMFYWLLHAYHQVFDVEYLFVLNIKSLIFFWLFSLPVFVFYKTRINRKYFWICSFILFVDIFYFYLESFSFLNIWISKIMFWMMLMVFTVAMSTSKKILTVTFFTKHSIFILLISQIVYFCFSMNFYKHHIVNFVPPSLETPAGADYIMY